MTDTNIEIEDLYNFEYNDHRSVEEELLERNRHSVLSLTNGDELTSMSTINDSP